MNENTYNDSQDKYQSSISASDGQQTQQSPLSPLSSLAVEEHHSGSGRNAVLSIRAALSADNNGLSPSQHRTGFFARPVLLTSADHHSYVIHHDTQETPFHSQVAVSPSSLLSHIPNFHSFDTHDDDEPDFSYLRFLVSFLLLTTLLASASAVDARFQCASREYYNVYELFDDDQIIFSQLQKLQEKKLCLEMWRFVIVPVGAVTLLCSVVSLWRIRPSIIRRLIYEAPTKLQRRKECFNICRGLLLTFISTLIFWSYGISTIMLQPRTDYFMSRDNTSDNPFHSLAAVDYMGHVGDNANLYYTSWGSLVLSLVICYQIVQDTIRQYRRYQQIQTEESVFAAKSGDNNVEAMLSYTKRQIQEYHHHKKTWYNSFYRLRIRSGIWVAALFASCVVMLSSVHIWGDVLVPTAMNMSKRVKNVWDVRHTCPALAQHRYDGNSESLPPQLCARTMFSIVCGCVAALLCLATVLLHRQVRHEAASVVEQSQLHQYSTHQDDLLGSRHHNFFLHLSNRTYLQFEFGLSVVLCVILSLNAVFATGVQGPASTVGNLYYSSWIAFLLCLRITLGCLEELYNIEKEEHESEEEGMEMTLRGTSAGADGPSLSYEAPTIDGGSTSDRSGGTKSSRCPPIRRQATAKSTTDLFDNLRAQRLRRLLFLAIFSTVCTASALDSALNQDKDLTVDQKYVIAAPTVVALLCVVQFFMCLRTYTYVIVSNVCTGLILSMTTFGLWLGALIIMMHSDNSWAVNAVGDIKAANLYYFSWASIITAGLHMSSYLTLLLGLKKKDYLTVAWIAVVKVCFVIFGAGIHIWFNTKKACTLEDLEGSAVTFCSRTIFAIVVSLTGMVVGGLVSFVRMLFLLCCATSLIRVRAHVEMVISVFLVLLFGVAVAFITGIGGPGQSVGDMFYSTWLAFFIAIFVGMTCVREIVKQDQQSEMGVAEEAEKVADSEDESSAVLPVHFTRMT
jgi:hypothetical protein